MIPPWPLHGHLFAILRELEERKPAGRDADGAILQELAGSIRRRGFIVLISDLLDRTGGGAPGLKQLRSRGNDVIVFHLLDRDELEFPFEESTLFQDLEEDLKLLTDPPTIRSAYLKALQALIEKLPAVLRVLPDRLLSLRYVDRAGPSAGAISDLAEKVPQKLKNFTAETAETAEKNI